MKCRQSADYLKRLKQRASIDAVDYKYQRALQNVRKTGSDKAFCVRHIIRGIVHKIEPFGDLGLSYPAIAYTLKGIWCDSITNKTCKECKIYTLL